MLDYSCTRDASKSKVLMDCFSSCAPEFLINLKQLMSSQTVRFAELHYLDPVPTLASDSVSFAGSLTNGMSAERPISIGQAK